MFNRNRKPKNIDGQIRVSVDGMRRELCNSINEMKGYINDIVSDEDFSKDELVEVMNDVIRNANLLNFVYIKGDESFNEIPDVCVNEIDVSCD